LRLFVTGGSGFLGRRIVAAAADAGHEVTVLTRREAVHDMPGHVTVVRGDVTDTGAFPQRLRDATPEVVIHAAAIIPNDDPHLTFVNVTGTANVVSALEQAGTRPRMVFVSSFAVEDVPPTPYSESKLAAEAVVRASQLPFVILRPTLVYGAGDANNTAALVQRMQAGTQWLPGGGQARIQPVHVDDVAAACLAAATVQGIEGRTYRLGGPEALPVARYREAVRDATGGAGRIKAIPLSLYGLAARSLALIGIRRALGVLQFHQTDHSVDIAEARRDLGFDPTPLDEGLSLTFR
jgi:NADH dehydrogenase